MSTNNIILHLLMDGFGDREELRLMSGYTDRQIRKSINELRKEGHTIINMEDGKGYRITDDKDEFIQWKKLYLSHAFDCIKTAREMERKFK